MRKFSPITCHGVSAGGVGGKRGNSDLSCEISIFYLSREIASLYFTGISLG